MRIITLEEHFAIPAMVARIDPALIARRGFPMREATPQFMHVQEALAELGAQRLADMDASGITLQVLSVSGPGADLLPAGEGVAFARDYNDALAATVARHPERFAGFAHLPMTTPVEAAKELERAVQRLGFHGALINGTTEGRFLDDPRFAPILAAAETLAVPIYLHPGLPPAPIREAYYQGIPEEAGFLLGGPGWGWHAETALHVLRLVLSGTLDRHPRLQLIIGHLGEGLPAMLARCDQVFGHFAAQNLRRKVSEAILAQVHLTTSGFFSLAPFLAALLTFGVERLMFSVDYPYSGNEAGRKFLNLLPVAPADGERIAHGNADRLLRLSH
uniref:Amidohydrolase n=1 Tax=Acidicaldus sp. TaxID=1872105 RepID=A0A8J4HAA0_9PROT